MDYLLRSFFSYFKMTHFKDEKIETSQVGIHLIKGFIEEENSVTFTFKAFYHHIGFLHLIHRFAYRSCLESNI